MQVFGSDLLNKLVFVYGRPVCKAKKTLHVYIPGFLFSSYLLISRVYTNS